MMGLEPTTFCMASASGRSLLFAPVRSIGRLQRFPSQRANKTEPERTPNLAILATEPARGITGVAATSAARVFARPRDGLGEVPQTAELTAADGAADHRPGDARTERSSSGRACMLFPVPRSRLQSLIADRARLAVANRRVFPYLVVVTLVLGVVAGFVVTLVDRDGFPTFGDGLWWAIVTLGTVGYGDLVPTNSAGRAVGSVVIIVGVTFIAFLTAVVTSSIVSADQEKAADAERRRREVSDEDTRKLLREVVERLAVIEARLDERPTRE
jgi:Ion channel